VTRSSSDQPRRAYVGVGANVGAVEGTLRGALEDLGKLLEDVHASSLYRTAPLHRVEQPDFVNAVVSGVWAEDAETLLAALHEIESRYGRNRRREVRFGPRTLDLDLLLLGDMIRGRPEVSLPHPRMAERRFVLEPLVELAPELRDPQSGRLFADMLQDLENQRVERVGEWR
jgi:2-amino-4-hydroxy-6-hydroxymethyldihydropteridine diphosphokinase